MPDFNKGSTFNKDANFQGVKFGADAPLLETELNELQDIQTEARADIIRDTIPSGFVQLGELDFDYMLNNENCVKMKTDSVAYVNGYKVVIPKDTIVDIGKAPEKDAREDLLFLEVWKEEVTKDSVLTVAGGEGQAQISNTILDDRVGQETSRRVALKWRIRHVANVNFSLAPYGLDYIGTEIIDGQKCFRVAPQGGLESPYYDTDWKWAFRLSNYYQSNGNIMVSGVNKLFYDMNDMGLYVSGHKDRKTLKTIDGFVYAIPMFKLYRKPSCGKAIPFEYQKINPKVDYSKFAELMKEEKVERVVTETIQGQSLVNLMPLNYSTGSGLPSITKLENGVKGVTTKDNGSMAFGCSGQMFKPNTEYTILCDLNLSVANIEVIHQTESNNYPSLATLKNGRNKIKFTTQNTSIKNLLLGSAGKLPLGTSFEITNCVILEGDWTNKPLPKYFTGLKSLGEDEGNLITVKNGILNESSYDPDTGTPKLNTVSGANYITSDNLIMPTIEGQVKRGETKVSDLADFGKIDNLVGDEVVDFTKIKGRTLQNLVNQNANLQNYKLTGYYVDRVLCDLSKLKQNVTYTLIYTLELKENTSGENYNRVTIGLSNNMNNLEKELKNLEIVPTLGKRKIMCSFSISDLSDYKYLSLRPIRRTTLPVEGEYIVINTSEFLILEGDYTSTPLAEIPFIEGIKSVGEDENNKVVVKRTGKNLWDINCLKTVTGSNGGYSKHLLSNLKPNRQYTITLPNNNFLGKGVYIAFTNDLYYSGTNPASNKFVKFIAHSTGSNPTEIKITTDNTPTYVTVAGLSSTSDVVLDGLKFLQIEEGTVATEFKPYKEYKQEITLKEPLRSLPNGVCDTIEGNKVIRRVGKVILNGTENWDRGSNEPSGLYRMILDISNIKINRRLICDTMPVVEYQDSWNNSFHCVSIIPENPSIIVYLKVSNTSVGFKTWLSQNPTTVYYELANPVEELIEPNYNKESIKTYQLDAPLRSLPNGVKDEIIDGKLIRRCGEVILDGSEKWEEGLDLTNTRVFYDRTHKDLAINSQLISSSFIGRLVYNEDLEGIYALNNGNIALRISKSKLSSSDSEGLKTWLKANPIKLIYELATPIEIPLKEVLPSKVNFSLERQFKYSDNYLLELPNGVKDTVENGKVTRKVKKVVLNGSENWIDSTDGTTVQRFCTDDLGLKNNGDTVVNIFASIPSYTRTELYNSDLFGISSALSTGNYSKSVVVGIENSKLSANTIQAFKTWLSNNPITVMFELATPITEELSGNNNRYVPYHEDNTYCGSLYIGNGTNDTYTDTVIKSESVVINTPFRESTGKLVVNDCKYKKTNDGYDIYYQTGKFKNKCMTSNLTGLINNQNGLDLSYLLKSKTYTISGSFEKLESFSNAIGIVCLDSSNKEVFAKADSTTLSLSSGTFSITFTIPYNATKTILGVHSTSLRNVKLTKIQIEEGGVATSYEDYVQWGSYFENTESNDIEDLRHQVSLTGFNYEQILNESFDLLLRGML